MDRAGRIYQRDADQDPGDAGLHRYHRPEHPRAVWLRRRAERDLRQQEEDGTVDRGVSGSAERHRRSAGVQARGRALWVRADSKIPATIFQ